MSVVLNSLQAHTTLHNHVVLFFGSKQLSHVNNMIAISKEKGRIQPDVVTYVKNVEEALIIDPAIKYTEQGRKSMKQSKDRKEKVYVMYPPHELDRVLVTRKDLQVLRPGEFLNDTIVDFYLKYVIRELTPPENQHRVHLFSSFFYKRWITTTDVASRYEAVKKWSGGVNLFEKDFIIVPINEHLHWTLAIICYPRLIVQQASDVDQHQSTAPLSSASPLFSASPPSLQPVFSEQSVSSSSAKISFSSIRKTREPNSPFSSSSSSSSSSSVSSAVKNLAVTPAPSVVMRMYDSFTRFFSTSSTPKNSKKEKKETAKQHQRPCILYLDSLGGTNQTVASTLREFLLAEWDAQMAKQTALDAGANAMAELGVTSPAVNYSDVFQRENLPLLSVQVPMQNNSCDCGVFLLHYAELFCKDPWPSLAADNLHRPRWFTQHELGQKRDAIRMLLRDLHLQQFEEEA